MSVTFPPELVEAVLEKIQPTTTTSRRTLSSCSLLSRNFRNVAQRLLLTNLSVANWSTERVMQLADTLVREPRLSAYIQSIDISFPRFPFINNGSSLSPNLWGDQEYDIHLGRLLLQLSSLDKLSISWSSRLPRSWQTLSDVLQQALLFHGSGVTDGPRRLTSISISGIWGLPLELVVSSPHLQHLRIRTSGFDGLGLPWEEELARVSSRYPLSLQLKTYEDDATNMCATRDLLSLSPSVFSSLTSFRLKKVTNSLTLIRDLECVLNACANTLESFEVFIKLSVKSHAAMSLSLPFEMPQLRSMTLQIQDWELLNPSSNTCKHLAFFESSLAHLRSYPSLTSVNLFLHSSFVPTIAPVGPSIETKAVPYHIMAILMDDLWRRVDSSLAATDVFPSLTRLYVEVVAGKGGPGAGVSTDVEDVLEASKHLPALARRREVEIRRVARVVGCPGFD